MRKWLLLIIFPVLLACTNETEHTREEKVLTSFEGLPVFLKKSIPESALTLSIADYRSMLGNSSKGLQGEEGYTVSIESLNVLAREIESENSFPSFYDLSRIDRDIEIIQGDFPNLRKEEIAPNIEKIKAFYAQEARWALYERLRRFEPGVSPKAGDYPGGTNSQEFWLLFANLWHIIPTYDAKIQAEAYTAELFPKNVWGEPYLNRADAFRHSTWNALICKNVGGTKAERMAWATTFTDAHENGSPPPTDIRDNAMDFHNNLEGRKYFDYASTESWFLFIVTVTCPENETIKNFEYWKANTAHFFTDNGQLPGMVDDLVYFSGL